MTISSSCWVFCSMIVYNTGLACDKSHCKPIPDSAYCVRPPSTLAQLAISRPTTGLCGSLLEYAPLARMDAAPTHLHKLDRAQQRALHIIGPDAILQSVASRQHVADLSFLYKLLCMSGPDQLSHGSSTSASAKTGAGKIESSRASSTCLPTLGETSCYSP